MSRQIIIASLLVAACGATPPGRPDTRAAVVYVPPPVAASAETPDDPRVPLAGFDRASLAGSVWTGEGLQNDGQRWHIELRVADADAVPCAFATYAPEPDRPLQCRAEWRCGEGTTPVHLRGQERITEGTERCIDGCLVEVDIASGVARFDCRAEGVSATAQLQRTE